MHKVLIIEDDVDTAKLLAIRFHAVGFQTGCAVDGAQGIKEAHKFEPDIIILDLLLPAGGGLSVLKSLELSEYTSRIPVIVYTGMQNKEYEHKVKEYKLAAYIEKPYSLDGIVEKAQEILSQG